MSSSMPKTSNVATKQPRAQPSSLPLFGSSTRSPAYILQWSRQHAGAEVKITPLSSSENLTSHLKALVPSLNGACGGLKSGQNQPSKDTRLVVIRGSSQSHLTALQEATDIDRALIEAHISGRTYLPSRRQSQRRMSSSWVYPEILTTCNGDEDEGEDMTRNPDDSENTDSRFFASTYTIIEDPGAPAKKAVFCRASLWSNTPRATGILLIDPPPWRYSAHTQHQALRERQPSISSSWTAVSASDLGDYQATDQSSITTDGEMWMAEKMLQCHLKDSVTHDDTIDCIFEIVAYHKWIVFFGQLGFTDECMHHGYSRVSADHRKLYWDMAKALETNLDSTRNSLFRRPVALPLTMNSPYADWSLLLGRLNQRIAIISIPKLQAPHLSCASSEKGDSMMPSAHIPTSPTTAADTAARRRKKRQHDITYRDAINRLTVLQGIMTPFQLVGTIFSMSDEYRPGAPGSDTGQLFWVFFVAAGFVSALILTIIYADMIRKFEVWVETKTGYKGIFFRRGLSRGTPAHPATVLSEPAPFPSLEGRRTSISVMEVPPADCADDFIRTVEAEPTRRDDGQAKTTATACRIHGAAVSGQETPTRRLRWDLSQAGIGQPARTSLHQAHFGAIADETMPNSSNSSPGPRRFPRPRSTSPEGHERVSTNEHVEVVSDGGVRARYIIAGLGDEAAEQRAWRRQLLGWGGALKSIIGMGGPHRDVDDIPAGVPMNDLPSHLRTRRTT